MSRVQGHLVMIAGCLFSLVSFCLLPCLVVPYPSFAFTGLQLVTLGPKFLLPGTFVVYNTLGRLGVYNIPFIWVPLLLVVLLLLAAVGDMWLSRQGEPTRKGITLPILIVAILALCFSLCGYGYNLVVGCCVPDHSLYQYMRGSLFTPGFGGLLVGLVVALIGGMITLRTKRRHPEMPKG